MTVVARRPPFLVLHHLLAIALLAISLPAQAVNQIGGGIIPQESASSQTCASNASNCINDNEKTEGGAGDIVAKETATISQETFTPLCELTFKVIGRGADYRNTFGWYAIQRDEQGEPVAPELTDLHVFLDCNDAVGTEKTLTLPKDVGEIGFFLANKGSSCVSTTPDPLGATLAEQPTNLFFSQRAFNSDSNANSDGKIHLLVWQGRANPNAFYFGWEDQNNGGDNDFEDLMTYVTGIQCSGGGDACEVEGELGVCADGVTQCRDGELQCVATQGKGPEACNGLDDDCDGETDDGDDLCSAGEICIKGRCQPPCGTGEFRCEKGEVCVQGVCIEAACAQKECDAGEVCRDGACVAACSGVVCPFGAACRAGLCVDVCEGVECDAGFVCEVRESSEGGMFVGVCSSCDCRGCGDGKSCVDHLCVENECKDRTCNTGTRCVAGECVDNCADAKCPAGQRCEAGSCVGDPNGGNGVGGEGSGGDGDGGGIVIIDPSAGRGGSTNGPDDGGVGGSSNYVEAKGCSCETPGARRSSVASLTLLGLLLGAGVARTRRKRG